jgi:putative FmdB family regulatory protein
MPIYIYECKNCLSDFKVSHSMTEDWANCEICQSSDIARKPLFFTNLSKKKDHMRKTGDITKEYIESAKEDLKNHIKELDDKR